MQEHYSLNSIQTAAGNSPERVGLIRRNLVRGALVAAALTGGALAETGTALADATPQPTTTASATPEQGVGDDRCAVLPLPAGCDSPAGPIDTPKTVAPNHDQLHSPELPHTGAPIGEELALGLGLAAAGAIALQAGRTKQ